jgi:3-hydroxybutyryl-CoA dehydrogenase
VTPTRIAVAGPGRMGVGIAVAFAQAGRPVRLVDLKERPPEESARALARAREAVEASLGALAGLGLLAPAAVDALGASVAYGDAGAAEGLLADVEVVFGAVPEVMALKRGALARIGAAVPAGAVIASTTSTFRSDALAGCVPRPERYLNTHWLNPAELIPLVELGPARETAATTLGTMRSLLEGIGKHTVTCAAAPGFIVPRIQCVAMNEAARLVEEGVASPEDVDAACRLGLGVRFAILGLLEFIDWGGNDTLHHAGCYLREALGSDRYAPPAIVAEHMASGANGLREGRGFHDYAGRDLGAYRLETTRRLVELLRHLGLLPAFASAPPGS